ncbi:MAG: putative glycoside hydrolase, partial [Clostridia bacterium]|nr:putative glycoside hydrolase [Clostridia bacterium]
KITNNDNVITSYQISTEINSETFGYISPSSLVNSKTELMGVVYSDVDYSGFAKNSSYTSNPPIEVRGVYVSASTASNPEKVDKLIQIANETDINTFIINVKDDSESMLFHSEAAAAYCPSANEVVYIRNIEAFIKKLKDNNIYLIARIVAFKSPKYALEHPDKAIVYKESGEMYYKDKSYWASPYDRDLWEYNVLVAKEAIALGFNEIQFDYVRFPDNGPSLDPLLDFRNSLSESKTKAIQEFLKYAYKELSPLEAYVAADLFAWTATSETDLGIGQHWEALTDVVDYICPMMYPSHYGPGIYGLDVPDAHPYTTIFESSSDALLRNRISMTPAIIRPWIQDFTATWVKGHITYGIEEIKAQIQALKDNGINEYMLWNASNVYTEGALLND